MKFGEFCRVMFSIRTFWQRSKHDQIGTRQGVAGFYMARLFRFAPPAAPLPSMVPWPVNVMSVKFLAADKWNEIAAALGFKPVARHFHEITLVGGCQQGCARFEQYGRFGAQVERLAQIGSRRKRTVPPPMIPHSSNAFWIAVVSKVMPSPLAPNSRTSKVAADEVEFVVTAATKKTRKREKDPAFIMSDF